MRYTVFGLMVLASALYFIAERIVANAWPSPGYSFINNYVSDLGVPLCTTANRFVCSPLHDVMNATFFVMGVVSLIGMIAFASLFSSVQRWVVTICGLIQSVGIMMVSVAPGSFAEDITNDRIQMALHTLGALFGILGTAAVAILVGIMVVRKARTFGLISIALGAIPIASLILQMITGLENLGLGRGGFERLGVYSVVLWLGLIGTWGLISTRRNIAQDNQ